MAKGGVVWDSNTLSPHLSALPTKLDTRVGAMMEYFAGRGQNHMRSTAPWTDQTSNARNGLFGKAYKPGDNKYRITYYHTVPYGIWLEVRWDGKYRVIVPTVQKMGGELMKSLNKLLGKLT